MRLNRSIMAAAVLALGAAGAVEAQVVVSGGRSAVVVQRGVLGIMTQTIVTSTGAAVAGQRVISGAPGHRVVVEVVPESPAAKAGIVRGDTIIAVNGGPVTDQSMSAFEPGQTVVLRVRRNGSERDVRVVADSRAGTRYTVALPDSVNRRVSVIMEAARADMTLAENSVRMLVERMVGDSLLVFRMGGDTVHYLRATQAVRDSLRMHVAPLEVLARVHADSVRTMFSGDGQIFRVRADTMNFSARPLEVFAATAAAGARAVYGAELSELNPGLAEYFGTQNGVLVLNAREGTPAARAGLRAGDVIVQVNQTAVTSVISLRQLIERVQPDVPVQLRVLRHGAPVNVTIPR